ncbi:pectin lyase fold/virulence factor [Pseudoneurospora amorphoporcata]|uniref:galacturonan 1,4-alpha-galacturonidase n=1 Tax=Pseudoneurospora amorphoporcata TaxID=241081 RepID=A0AAN6NWV5_9PEZI|nr:pectin lyase fold/virulence factor [Pseudoneurospora amorphoporcata]
MLCFRGSPTSEGSALFDGQGQIWIDQNRNNANRQGRPISLTIWKGENIWVDGITWRQSQFWHTYVAHSRTVTMTNLDMNSTSNSKWKAVNTDEVNTWNSRGVRIGNWTVTGGDNVNQPIYVTSCIYSYSNCDSSRIPITGIRWET